MILRISEATVNYHLKNAMGLMGAHSKAHAVAKAMTLGIFGISDSSAEPRRSSST